MAGGDEFQALFDRFKAMLQPYAERMHVSVDAPGYYGVDMAAEAERTPATWFAGTRLGKRYVSYYLMPIYVQPSLADDLSPALRKRRQGKSCFNLTRVDEALLAELEALTARGYEATAGDVGWGAARRQGRAEAQPDGPAAAAAASPRSATLATASSRLSRRPRS